jgi:hypothetical protein
LGRVRARRRVRAGPSVGGSFAAASSPMVLKRCSSERGGRENRFWAGGKGERRRTAFGERRKHTGACEPRTVNGMSLRHHHDVQKLS